MRSGGGLGLEAYPDSMYGGIDRFTAGWFENLLIPVWLPLVPHVLSKLEQGARLADVGCGRGRALVKLAQAFPESRFVGYEIYAPNVDTAMEKGTCRRLGGSHHDPPRRRVRGPRRSVQLDLHLRRCA